MHEMSLAMNIVDIVSKTARENRAKTVNSVDIEIGELAGVLIDSLSFCFDAVRKNTVAERAGFNIISIPGRGWCGTCHKEFKTESFLTLCPYCESHAIEIVGGKELKIKSINVD